MTPGELWPFLALGALLGVDVVSFPQAMTSRPIVGATLAGLLAGSPLAGVTAGAALECLALETLPFGASRYPEWGSASVVGGVVAVQGAAAGTLPVASAWVIGVLAAIATAWVGGWTMVGHRRLIGRIAASQSARIEAGSAGTVVALQLGGLAIDALRAALLTAAGLLVALPIAGELHASWSLDPLRSRAALVVVAAAVAASAMWKLFHGFTGTRRLFLAGLFVGTVLVVWRG